MTIVSIMIPTGGFQRLAYWCADFSKGRLFTSRTDRIACHRAFITA